MKKKSMVVVLNVLLYDRIDMENEVFTGATFGCVDELLDLVASFGEGKTLEENKKGIVIYSTVEFFDGLNCDDISADNHWCFPVNIKRDV